MGKEILMFGDTEIEKKKKPYNKTPNFGGDVDIEKVLVSNKIYFGEKNINTLLVTGHLASWCSGYHYCTTSFN